MSGPPYNSQPPYGQSYSQPPYGQSYSQPYQGQQPAGQYYPPTNDYNYNYNQHPQQVPPPGSGPLGFNTMPQPYPGNPATSGGGYMPNASYGQGPPYPGAQPQQPGQSYPSVYPNVPSQGSQPYGAPSYGQQPMNQYGGHHQPVANFNQTMYSNPSIKPYAHFSPNQDAEILRNAMKGLGCNNDKVIQVLCARSNSQRQDIARVFKTMYGKDLLKELKSELRGDFEELILALMTPPVVYDAEQLHKAMARLGTRENVLIEIMTTRTNAQIFQLKTTYRQMFGRELEDDLTSETSGYFKRLLVSMCAGGRDEGHRADALQANQDARKLYRAGEQRLGTDEAQFSAILAAQNFNQLRLVFDEYQKVTNHSIEQAINNEFSGDVRDGLLAIIKAVRNRSAFFAELLYNAMRGLGTRDTDLIRIIVTRSEIDLADIRQQYQRMYNTTLEGAIAGDCSGSYKEGLIALVKGN